MCCQASKEHVAAMQGVGTPGLWPPCPVAAESLQAGHVESGPRKSHRSQGMSWGRFTPLIAVIHRSGVSMAAQDRAPPPPPSPQPQ